MSSWIDTVNFAIGVAGFTISLLGLFLSASTKAPDEWTGDFFPLLFGLLEAYTGFDLVSQISSASVTAGSPEVSQAALFGESFFSALLMPALTVLILHFAHEDHRKSKVYYAVTILLIMYMVMLVSTQITGTFYYYTPDNVYHRGPLYPALLAPAMSIMAINLGTIYVKRNRMDPEVLRAFVALIAVNLICMLIQIFAYGILMILLGATVSSLVMFVYLVDLQAEERLRQKELSASQQARIAVLQMRPHFVANTLMSIYYLCGRDPDAAQNVILDFSSYLRKNFSAIAGDETIPFSEELEHTRAYLAVETVRFEDMLSVEFDTPHMNFHLPPLTLQPIVENSVQHGLDPDGDPIHILVSSRDTGTESIVTVVDNGPGFDIDDIGDVSHAKSSSSYSALANIRERLELMCSGTLEIQSTTAESADPLSEEQKLPGTGTSAAPRRGTTVIIHIPHNAK